ncbi:uncharacterized protein [Medicago truncatula]|nr:uncharacterized protein LOC25481021 [Medicago truncatula]
MSFVFNIWCCKLTLFLPFLSHSSTFSLPSPFSLSLSLFEVQSPAFHHAESCFSMPNLLITGGSARALVLELSNRRKLTILTSLRGLQVLSSFSCLNLERGSRKRIQATNPLLWLGKLVEKNRMDIKDKAPFIAKAEKLKEEYEKTMRAYNMGITEKNASEEEGSHKSKSEFDVLD